MRTGIVINVGPADRTRLEAVIADRNSPQKHVWRGDCQIFRVWAGSLIRPGLW